MALNLAMCRSVGAGDHRSPGFRLLSAKENLGAAQATMLLITMNHSLLGGVMSLSPERAARSSPRRDLGSASGIMGSSSTRLRQEVRHEVLLPIHSSSHSDSSHP
jgi:hypothetical protein